MVIKEITEQERALKIIKEQSSKGPRWIGSGLSRSPIYWTGVCRNKLDGMCESYPKDKKEYSKCHHNICPDGNLFPEYCPLDKFSGRIPKRVPISTLFVKKKLVLVIVISLLFGYAAWNFKTILEILIP